jgi:3-phosphoshikimate 1-carboxyvinyltransferase
MTGGEIDTYHDHRIAMSFSIAALRANGDIIVNDCDHVATSFPNFASLSKGIGLRITEAL